MATGVHVASINDGEWEGGSPDKSTPEMSRVVSRLKAGNFGGGFVRYPSATPTGPWTLTYDEVLYVIEGELTVEAEGEKSVAKQGDLVVLSDGTSVTYSGTPGTTCVFLMTPYR